MMMMGMLMMLKMKLMGKDVVVSMMSPGLLAKLFTPC